MSLKIICTFTFVSKSLRITYFSSNTDFLPSYEKWNIRKRYEVLSQNQGREKWFRSHSTLATIVEMSSLRCKISTIMDHHSYSLPSGSCKHPRLKDVLSLQKTEMNLGIAKSLLEIPNGVKLKGMSKVKCDNHQPSYNIFICINVVSAGVTSSVLHCQDEEGMTDKSCFSQNNLYLL